MCIPESSHGRIPQEPWKDPARAAQTLRLGKLQPIASEQDKDDGGGVQKEGWSGVGEGRYSEGGFTEGTVVLVLVGFFFFFLAVCQEHLVAVSAAVYVGARLPIGRLVV